MGNGGGSGGAGRECHENVHPTAAFELREFSSILVEVTFTS